MFEEPDSLEEKKAHVSQVTLQHTPKEKKLWKETKNNLCLLISKILWNCGFVVIAKNWISDLMLGKVLCKWALSPAEVSSVF